MADPNACGHATTTPGCGGCDPGAIEFVRDDYGPWRRVAGGALDEEALGRPFTDQEEAQYALGRKHEQELQRDRLVAMRSYLQRVLDGIGDTEHNGHDEAEGEPECAACWIADVRNAIELAGSP